MGLIRNLLSEGNDVICIAPTDGYSDRLVQEGCTFIHVPMEARSVNPFKDLALTRRLYKIYKQVRPDVILQYTIKPNIYGTLAARTLKIPVINNVCGLGSAFIRGGLVTNIVNLLYKTAFLFAGKVFFQNPDDYELFVSKGITSTDKSEILPGSGINTRLFNMAIKDKNDQFTFLMISRLIKDKGVLEYLNAAEMLKKKDNSVKIQLLGAIDEHATHGISREVLESYVRSGVIEYLGTTDDVRPFIQNADCIVLPSYREGTPRTLLEASAMGKPIIATNTPGCNQIVKKDLNGILVEVKNADSLLHGMTEMKSTPHELRTKWGSNGRKLVEDQFDETIVIEKYKKGIKELTQSF